MTPARLASVLRRHAAAARREAERLEALAAEVEAGADPEPPPPKMTRERAAAIARRAIRRAGRVPSEDL